MKWGGVEFEATSYTAQLLPTRRAMLGLVCVWDLFFNLVTIFPLFFPPPDSESYITSHHGYIQRSWEASFGIGWLGWAFSLDGREGAGDKVGVFYYPTASAYW